MNTLSFFVGFYRLIVVNRMSHYGNALCIHFEHLLAYMIAWCDEMYYFISIQWTAIVSSFTETHI